MRQPLEDEASDSGGASISWPEVRAWTNKTYRLTKFKTNHTIYYVKCYPIYLESEMNIHAMVSGSRTHREGGHMGFISVNLISDLKKKMTK